MLRTLMGMAALALYMIFGHAYANAIEKAITNRDWFAIVVILIVLIWGGYRHGNMLFPPHPQRRQANDN